MSIQFTPQRCPHCKKKMDTGQRIHPACIDEYAQAQAAKSARASAKRVLMALKVDKALTRQKLDKLKNPSAHEAECRTIVQKIARIRDRDDGCISCHMPANYSGLWHGSHFRPAGNNAAVQFHLWNIHKSCAQCNLFKGGNLSAYRPRLVEKIGLDRVEWLESQNQAVKTNVDYLIRFKAVMGKRLRRIEKQLRETT